MNPNLAKLNRLRVNAGKTELKAWKASGDALLQTIAGLEAEGFTDALPGADVKVAPVTDDPVVAAAIKPVEDPATETPSLADSALANSVDTSAPVVKKATDKSKRPQLARGLDTDQMARQSRYAVQSARETERKEDKAERKEAKRLRKLAEAEAGIKPVKDRKSKKVKLSPEDKKQIKDEAADRIVGKVDAKAEPEKAKRQKKHVEDKQAARAGKPKVEKNTNEVTIADLCRELGIDAKQGRAKMRRHEAKIEALHTKGQDRWTFPASARDTLVGILKPS